MPSRMISVDIDIFDDCTEQELAELLSDDVLKAELKKRLLKVSAEPSASVIIGNNIVNLPRYKRKDIICDILGLQHSADENTICEMIRNITN